MIDTPQFLFLTVITICLVETIKLCTCCILFSECGPLTDPPNGLVFQPDGTTLNDETTYTCNTGYYLSHTNSRVCQADGSWSNTPAICVIYGDYFRSGDSCSKLTTSLVNISLNFQ